MYEVLQRKVEQSGCDQQERLTLSLDTMFARERHSAIGDLFSYWLSKRDGTAELPVSTQFSERHQLPNSILPFIASVETQFDSPLNYIVRNHPGKSAWGDKSDLRIGDFDNSMNARSCANEYMICKTMRTPLYSEISQNIGSKSRHFARLMLPISGEKNEVVKVIYAVRIFSATGFASNSSIS